jgi:hypothetical protein
MEIICVRSGGKEASEMLLEETWGKLGEELSYDGIVLSEAHRSIIVAQIKRAEEKKDFHFWEGHRIKDQVTFSKLVIAYRALPQEDKDQFSINFNSYFVSPLLQIFSALRLSDEQYEVFQSLLMNMDVGRPADPIGDMLENLLEVELGRGRPPELKTEVKACLFIGIADFFEHELGILPGKTANGRFVCFMEILLSDPAIVAEVGGPMTRNSINKFWKEVEGT